MSLSITSTKSLRNGYEIPQLGLGTYKATDKTAVTAIQAALDAGYRHIDTAAFYMNEGDIGKAIKDYDIDREELFITTKLWNSDQGYEPAKQAFNKSLSKLDTDYIDLYLIHWPKENVREASWQALQELVETDSVRSIGVSNYTVPHLKELIEKMEIIPAVNQVELHPWLTQENLRQYCDDNEIVVEAYSPLVKGEKLDDPDVETIAQKYDKSVAQVLIRWSLQNDLVVLPKSSNPSRIKENAAVFDFELSQEDMGYLDSLNENYHCTWDPTTVS